MKPEQSEAITDIRLGEPQLYPNSIGDTWDPTWAEDGNLYFPGNDGSGWDKACSSNLFFNIPGLVEHFWRSHLALGESDVTESAQDGPLGEKANFGRNLIKTATLDLGDDPVETDLADENRPDLPS